MSLAADYIETPTYIAPYRPMSRSNEISQGNTEWMKMLHRVDLIPHLKGHPQKEAQSMPTSVPPPPQPQPKEAPIINNTSQYVPTKPEESVRQSNPHQVPKASFVSSNGQRFKHVPGAKLPLVLPAGEPPKPAPSTPFRPFRDEFRTDEYYRRYLQLSGNMAYKYPEPGYPRERLGAMGGTWRHIKEVGAYTGSQVCFVDGLVRLYDHDLKRQPSPNKQAPYMRASMATPAYAANRHNVSSYGKTLMNEYERNTYKPWQPSTQPPQNSMQPETPGRYKGFYSYGAK